MSVESSKQIWNLSKRRFLQEEVSRWIFSNKTFEIFLLAGIVVWVYFEFFSYGIYENIKYIGLIIVIRSIGAIRFKFILYQGYFDGYERGFEDAATCNCDYWGDTHNEQSDNLAITTVLEKIKNNEEKVSDANQKLRAKEVEKGISQLTSYIFKRPFLLSSNVTKE